MEANTSHEAFHSCFEGKVEEKTHYLWIFLVKKPYVFEKSLQFWFFCGIIKKIFL